MLNITDAAEIIENLREWGFVEMDIASVITGINDGHYSVGDIADLISALEVGDDDEAFVCAAHLGLA